MPLGVVCASFEHLKDEVKLRDCGMFLPAKSHAAEPRQTMEQAYHLEVEVLRPGAVWLPARRPWLGLITWVTADAEFDVSTLVSQSEEIVVREESDNLLLQVRLRPVRIPPPENNVEDVDCVMYPSCRSIRPARSGRRKNHNAHCAIILVKKGAGPRQGTRRPELRGRTIVARAITVCSLGLRSCRPTII